MSNRKLPRKQLVLPMHPDTKARLERCAEYFRNETPSSILEGLAHHFEERVLAPTQQGNRPVLTDKQRERYLAGKLTFKELVGHEPPRLKGKTGYMGTRYIKELQTREDRDERVKLSLHISGQAFQKIRRYCELHRVTIAFVLDRHARRLERYILAKLPEERRATFLAGELRPELPADIIAEPFHSNDNAAPEAA
jgi:hypothetical protein